ncbi:MAG: hypothetical protein DME19_03545 [Verrucomicrobia bacterium]|nr:MAG: hypothetical protein DME19_03545 [Verrucomicrobiota bacterium]
MSAKHQTFYVEKTERGWVVRTDANDDHLGPYSNWERAMTMALIFARDNQPSQVKVQTGPESWRVQYTFDARERMSA